ncbi:LOW QUALITY PROTEIN: platelet-activating factor acetylhydrolase [Rhynchonycteris naso]
MPAAEHSLQERLEVAEWKQREGSLLRCNRPGDCPDSCLALAQPLNWLFSPDAPITPSEQVNQTKTPKSAAVLGQTTIPRGSGPYSVGCTDLMSQYTNKSTFLRLYYPSTDAGHPDTIWIPNKEYFFGLSKSTATHWFVGKIMSLFFGSLTIPASWNSPVRTDEKPLIIFSHGLGGFRTIYSAIGIELASHGFIVAAVEHRDGSASATYYFNDQAAAEEGNKSWLYFKPLEQGEEEKQLRNAQVRQRAKECSQALDVILSGKPVKNVLDLEFDMQPLKDSIDRNKIAVIGHSFGGATVIQALNDDRRFRCGIALDAWMLPLDDDVYSNFSQPLFFINSEHFQYPDNIIKMKKCYLPGKERKMITIRGSVHLNFADFTFTAHKISEYILTLKGEIDSNVVIGLSNKASLAFLQKHLGLQKDFDKWDCLVEGEDDHLIPGTNIVTTHQDVTLHNSTGIEKQNLD